MPLTYDNSPNNSPLRQGEILGNIWEHRPILPPVEVSEGGTIEFESFHHPRMIVMNADCDLDWDFKARFPSQQQNQSPSIDENHPALIPCVFLCDVYEEEQIRPNIKGSDIWRRIKQNQDERYHHFVPAPLGNPPIGSLPDLYLDFKKVLALSTRRLYEGLGRGIERIAVVPPIYIHDLIHRFYGFHSRVGLPD